MYDIYKFGNCSKYLKLKRNKKKNPVILRSFVLDNFKLYFVSNGLSVPKINELGACE